MQNKHGQKIIAVTVTILALFLLVACDNFQPVKIGISVELSGATSDLGIAIRNGAQLAVEEINSLGGINGREIELIIKDDKGSTEFARKNDQELIDSGVVAIVGHVTSQRTSSVLDIINSNDVIMISGSATSSRFTGIDDNFFRLTVDTEQYALATSAHILNSQKDKEILLLYSEGNSAFVDPFIFHFTNDIEANGGSIIGSLPVCCNLDDFQELSAKISEINPKTIMAITTAYDLSHLVQYTEHTNVTPNWYSTLWAGTSELINKGGEAADGVELAMSFNPEDQSGEFLDFKYKYSKRYGTNPSQMALSGYTILQTLAKALQETNGNFRGLKEELIQIGSIQSIQGEIKMDEFGDVSRDIYITKVIDGTFIVIETYQIE